MYIFIIWFWNIYALIFLTLYTLRIYKMQAWNVQECYTSLLHITTIPYSGFSKIYAVLFPNNQAYNNKHLMMLRIVRYGENNIDISYKKLEYFVYQFTLKQSKTFHLRIVMVKIYITLCVCVHVCMPCVSRFSWRPEGATGFSEAGVTDSFQFSYICSWHWIQIS